jgi:hypothetical protein
MESSAFSCALESHCAEVWLVTYGVPRQKRKLSDVCFLQVAQAQMRTR